MVKKRDVSKVTAGSYEEVVRLLAILAKRDRTQTAFIHELDDLGFGPKRIAELVGTTPNTVSVALYQKDKKAGKKTQIGASPPGMASESQQS